MTGLETNNPLEGFHFMLRVEGVFDLPCKSIHAFTRENEYEYIQEGGLNDYVHMRRKPVSKPFTFEVERYVGIDYVDPLPNGAELILPVILLVSHDGGNFGSEVSRAYTFTGCTVISKQYGQLDAEQSGLLVETTTIAYRELLVVDVPRERPPSGAISFGGEGSKGDSQAGAMKNRRARTAPYRQETPELVMWGMQDHKPVRAKAGPGKTAQEKARLWKPDRSAAVRSPKAD